MGQALAKYLSVQLTEVDGKQVPLFGGVWAIFGHGNVAGLGEALQHHKETLPTLRAHNEQGMAHAAIAYAKAHHRRRMMACTTSIGPGATNMVTAAATAHTNRLPVLLLPGDTFASRFPDPVLQQVEDFAGPTVTANDCFRPVSRYWDRIVRAEQLLTSLPAALRVLTDPAECGPVTLALPQDTQVEAFDYPDDFFAPRVHRLRRARPDAAELGAAAEALRAAKRPYVVTGGGTLYSFATDALDALARTHQLPVAETQAGKGALSWDHPLQLGSLGVTGSSAANALAAEADVVLCVGTRLSDFTSASRTMFPKAKLVGLNVAAFDAHKHGALPLVGDARETLEELSKALSGWKAPDAWAARAKEEVSKWNVAVETATRAATDGSVPSDAQVLGAVNRASRPQDIVVCAAGGLPGELHKLWRTRKPGGYHVEYGYSCMGYELAGGLGVKLARPDAEVFVMLGDGSYLMMNSEIATAVAMNKKLTIVLLDNRGFGCIHRLQQATVGEEHNNVLGGPAVDFVLHARALGAKAEKVDGLAALPAALDRAAAAKETTVLVIETDRKKSTDAGGTWWDVPVAEVSPSAKTRAAREKYVEARKAQKLVR
ncbi:MAG: 3D-(3,5/4)-trihydroxycyclohexane-1,2-dione acylhydrolase (decyclizing) [Archangiaceae bacterium]|nr:3D-(3,5/4)-trihydroxycyclohexane-1,2-dione acylhydrolase (decyclizing) [Archangiaceae bacterium]